MTLKQKAQALVQEITELRLKAAKCALPWKAVDLVAAAAEKQDQLNRLLVEAMPDE